MEWVSVPNILPRGWRRVVEIKFRNTSLKVAAVVKFNFSGFLVQKNNVNFVPTRHHWIQMDEASEMWQCYPHCLQLLNTGNMNIVAAGWCKSVRSPFHMISYCFKTYLFFALNLAFVSFCYDQFQVRFRITRRSMRKVFKLLVRIFCLTERFCEKLIYVPLIRHGPHGKRRLQQFFVAAGTSIPSYYLAAISGYTDISTDRHIEQFFYCCLHSSVFTHYMDRICWRWFTRPVICPHVFIRKYTISYYKLHC
jgi:hypothetical protein